MESEETRAQVCPGPEPREPGRLQESENSQDQPSHGIQGADERRESELGPAAVDNVHQAQDEDEDPATNGLQDSLDKFLAYLPQHIMFCRILGYFQRVSKGFPVESERFGRFADLADDWQDERVDLSGMIIRFTNLFRDKPDIVLGLNEFLPGRYHINPDLSLELP